MSWSIRKGETHIISKDKLLKFTGATIYRWHTKACFLLKNDLVEKVIVRSVDNRDCMYIGGVLYFASKDVLDKLINDIINEIT